MLIECYLSRLIICCSIIITSIINYINKHYISTLSLSSLSLSARFSFSENPRVDFRKMARRAFVFLEREAILN